MKKIQLAGFAALLAIALHVIRDAVVRSSLPENPRRALLAWPTHPSAVIADRMLSIGKAARLHHEVDETLTGPVIEAARRAPLAIEPFLVAGVKAQTSGNEAAAGRLFEAAEERDPRAIAPHLFLSAHYSKVGQSDRSLTEFGRLLRLVPEAASQVSQSIAASVTKVGGIEKVRALVSHNENLRDDIMRALSADPGNLVIVLSLRTPTSTDDWRPIMIRSLINARRFDSAFALWATANKVDISTSADSIVFDPTFHQNLEGPFGWSFSASEGGAGLVEKDETTGLHVVSYGRENFTAASQVVLLPPGVYSLDQAARSTSGNLSSLSWQLLCLDAPRTVGAVSFATGGAHGQLLVPPDCRAQRLELTAASQDLPETLDALLGPIELRRVR